MSRPLVWRLPRGGLTVTESTGTASGCRTGKPRSGISGRPTYGEDQIQLSRSIGTDVESVQLMVRHLVVAAEDVVATGLIHLLADIVDLASHGRDIQAFRV